MTGIRGQGRRLAAADGGFSLVELMVVIVIAGVIGAAVMTFVGGVNRAGRFTESTSMVLDDARRAAERIQRETRRADSVEVGSNGVMMQLSVGGQVIRYTVVPAAGELRRSVDGGPSQILASGIAPTLTGAFTYDLPPPATREVGISLPLQPSGGGSGAEQTVDLAVRIRNVR